MYKHHEESIANMAAHYREMPEVVALFLVGSIATGTERVDSDVDGVAIVSREEYERRQKNGTTLEAVWGKCTYDGGYFDIHYHSRECLEYLLENGSEPMRNLFNSAQVLFCDDSALPPLVAEIPKYPLAAAQTKRLRFYCTMKQFYTYFFRICKPVGFMRHHVADGMIFNLYRLILIENEILFPSMRWLERTVANAPNKPDGIIELVADFMRTLSDDDAAAIVDAYEAWTQYDFPKEHSIVMNNFADKWEWE